MGKLAVSHKMSLASVGEGWNECYLTYTRASYLELAELRSLGSDLTDVQATELQENFIREHLTGGIVREIDGAGNPANVPFKIDEHLKQFTNELFNEIFTTILYGTPDPKDQTPTTESSLEASQNQ
jgi:hypothetical protein